MPNSPERPPSGLPVMLAGTFFFSVGSLLVKLTGQRLPNLEVVFSRSAVILLYSLILARRAGVCLPGRRTGLLALRGILGFAAYSSLFYTLIHLPLADATVLYLAFPLLVPIWAGLFLKEPLEKLTLPCLLLGAAGMLCITRPEFLFGGVSVYAPLAVAAGIGTALLSSLAVTLVRGLTATEHPLIIVMYAAAAGTVGAPLLGAADWLTPTWGEAAMLLGVGLCMSLGQHCITIGYARSTAARASVLFYMEVAFAAVLGFLVLDEVPDAMTLAGTTLIVGGAALLGLKRRS